MDQYISEIRLFPWNWAPKGWALCNGALLSIVQNQALFSLLGTTYGGDGRLNFGLPDLRGRTPIHPSNTIRQGALSGSETVTLNVNEMPQHNHMFNAVAAAGTIVGPAGHLLANNSGGANFYGAATALVALQPTSVDVTGGNQPHNNMQPYLVLNYCIATQGLYPTRN
jgi:microcystin-dependent protein